jgi:peptidoglycan/xylan/chitin deacetylase (PgdA/CDA1 family)
MHLRKDKIALMSPFKARELGGARTASTGFKLAFFGLLLLTYLQKSQSQTVAVTVDDLPYVPGNSKPPSPEDAKTAELANKKLLHAFSHAHIPATGFVVEQNVERFGVDSGRKILKNWIRSGFDLGNHTYSHADSDTFSVDDFEREIILGENTIGPLLQSVSRKPQYFRFPYNHTGDTKEKHDAIAAFLAARGYRLAPCTIDNSDYEFNPAYVLAMKRNDMKTAAKLRADYLSYTAAEIDWYSKLDKQVFGYEVPHIMLLHDSLLNADTISDVIALFKQRGYRFVTLAEALRDPAYATPETYITKFGPMWGYRWAVELHIKVNGRDEPDPPAWISKYIKEAVVGTN